MKKSIDKVAHLCERERERERIHLLTSLKNQFSAMAGLEVSL